MKQDFAKYAAELKPIGRTLLAAFSREYEINGQFRIFLDRNAEKERNFNGENDEDQNFLNQEVFRFIIKALFLKLLEIQKGNPNIISKEKNCFLLRCSLASMAERTARQINLFDFFEAKKQEGLFFEISDNLGSAMSLAIEKIGLLSVNSQLFEAKGQNVLGNIYELLIDGSQKKPTGKYYTPDFIVEYILDKTLSTADVLANPFLKILDPACGCGHFLFKAYDLLKNKFRQNIAGLRKIYKHDNYTITDNEGTVIHLKGASYWHEKNLHYHLLNYCLFGADIDSFAAEVSKAVLAAKEPGTKNSFCPAVNIINCDSLVKWETSPVFNANRDFWLRRYDYVIGNPPYVSFGLKRTAKLKDKTANYLRLNYPNSAEYKISYYALFLERSIELLAPGGQLGFITPDSFLLGRYFSKIRRFILGNCLINELVLLNQPVFAANIGFPVISIFKKKGLLPVPSGQPAHFIKAKKWAKNSPVFEYEYPQNYFEKQPYFRFRLFFSEIDKRIVDKMDNAPNTLKDVARIKTGMRSLTSQKDIISKGQEKAQDLDSFFKRGIISSSEVKRFFIDYQGNWLNVDPSKLNSGGWDNTVIENTKILIRQTGNFLIAAIDEDNLYHLNNVHSLSLPKDSTDICLEYILCIINSNLLNYYYQTISLEAHRAMAQTDIETLEKLPIVISFEHLETLTVIARKLKKSLTLFSRLKNNPSSPPFLKEKLKEKLLFGYIKKLNNGLNKTIYNLYGLTDDEIRYVEGRSNLYSNLYNNFERQA